MGYLAPVKPVYPILLCIALVGAACVKEKPKLSVTLTAKCRNCAVAYAGGVDHARMDTILSVYSTDLGDSAAGQGTWKVSLHDGDNIFLRACRLQPDTVLGPIEITVSGDVAPLILLEDTADCAQISQAVRSVK